MRKKIALVGAGNIGGTLAHLIGLNTVGLSRNGFSSDAIQQLKLAYKKLFLLKAIMMKQN